ncbi:hypothetical protein G7Z17_g4665 [Cylindrodendrum hubeiense]|uniref:Uncharacterized protein n=1 Tax=Cylindrodendrum hubeiense TaxID=595255 RepID=A0A9P5HIM4_9HYPO|nr:hypothetical protein G7Z17_g4665 [Cylindrodendrum hubeiense]
MNPDASDSGSSRAQSFIGPLTWPETLEELLRERDAILEHRGLHIHHRDCGCTYFTPSFFHDHIGMPKRHRDKHALGYWPFKYVANYIPDPEWPVREAQPPKHRTTNPVKGALKTERAGPKKAVSFVQEDAARCVETGKPVPPAEDNKQAQRRWRDANNALYAARQMARWIPEDRPLRGPHPTEQESINFRAHDVEVDRNLELAKKNGEAETVNAIERGILDFAMCVHPKRARGMIRLRNILSDSVKEDGMVGSYTGEEKVFAVRAWQPTIIPLERYADPETAMSYYQKRHSCDCVFGHKSGLAWLLNWRPQGKRITSVPPKGSESTA